MAKEEQVPNLLNKSRVGKISNNSNADEMQDNFFKINQAIAYLNQRKSAAFEQAAVKSLIKLKDRFSKMDHSLSDVDVSVKAIKLMQSISELDDGSLDNLCKSLFDDEENDNNDDDKDNNHQYNNENM
ncbi:hypothetical protein DY052_07675 [Apilactobacillus timberlakei]|uniref:hypothetical protein n=1 Tax=Apilactobacillus timberlakei TaxID=2008380 RepID=UPI00112ED6F8|nr:hypothetical protein [Apilactobacillus timberlakei]TPR13733.1 hypothetical protein DY052_07675 [Apilactobacillus timberlakei]